jgi:predicted HTH domain antitoxin
VYRTLRETAKGLTLIDGSKIVMRRDRLSIDLSTDSSIDGGRVVKWQRHWKGWKPLLDLGSNDDLMARSETTDADPDLVRAIGLFALGEVSEGRAAEIAGITRWDMREVLENVGLELRHGPRDTKELQRDADIALSLGETGTDGEE